MLSPAFSTKKSTVKKHCFGDDFHLDRGYWAGTLMGCGERDHVGKVRLSIR